MENSKILRPIDITITSGTSILITVPQVFLQNGKHYNLEFCLTEPEMIRFRDLIIGTEVVTIRSGLTGNAYVVETKTGNILYADRLILGHCYRLVWGNNGPANNAGTTGKVGHFLNLNTPCCARAYDPANTIIPTVNQE